MLLISNRLDPFTILVTRNHATMGECLLSGVAAVLLLCRSVIRRSRGAMVARRMKKTSEDFSHPSLEPITSDFGSSTINGHLEWGGVGLGE